MKLMRITVFLATLVLSLALLASCNLTLAATSASTSANISTKALLEDFQASPSAFLGDSLITPASPLYFLKIIREKIEVLLDGSKETKVMRQVEFGQRRLREISSLIKHNRQDLIPQTLEHYKLHIQNIEDLSGGDEDLQVKVTSLISTNLDILQQLYGQAGDNRAQQALRSALERVDQHNSDLIKKLSLPKQQELIKSIAKSQAVACRFLTMEASSSSLNDTEKVELGEKAKTCQLEVGSILKDQLLELRQKKM